MLHFRVSKIENEELHVAIDYSFSKDKNTRQAVRSSLKMSMGNKVVLGGSASTTKTDEQDLKTINAVLLKLEKPANPTIEDTSR